MVLFKNYPLLLLKNISAVDSDDSNTHGYGLVEFLSRSYTPQERTDPDGQFYEKGEWVFKGSRFLQQFLI